MSKTIKKSLIIILSAFLALAILFVGVNGTKPASASTDPTFIFSGASVRLESTDGLRFTAKINAALYNQVIDSEGNDIAGKRVGMVIVPETYVNEYKSAESFDGGYHDYFTQVKEGKMLDYVFNSESIAVNSADEYVLNAAIVDMLFDNYNLKFVAIGYLRVDGEYEYLAESEAKSFASVVETALEDENMTNPDLGADMDDLALLEKYDKGAYFNGKGVCKADDTVESYQYNNNDYSVLDDIPVPVTYTVKHNYGGNVDTEIVNAKNGDAISYRDNIKALSEYSVNTVGKSSSDLFGEATWQNDGEYVLSIDYTMAIPVSGEGLAEGTVHYRDIEGNELTGQSLTEKMTDMTSPLGNSVYKLTPTKDSLYIKVLGISPEEAINVGYKTLTMYVMINSSTGNPVAYPNGVASAASINSQSNVKTSQAGIRIYNVDGVRMSSVSIDQWSILEFNLVGCTTDAQEGYMDRIYAGLRVNKDTPIYIADVNLSKSEFSSIDDFLTVAGSNGQAQLTTYYQSGYSGLINSTTSIRVSQGTYFGSDNVIKFDFDTIGSRNAALQIQGVSPTWLTNNGIKKIVYEYYYDTATGLSSNPTIFNKNSSNGNIYAISPHIQTTTNVKMNGSIQTATPNAWNKVEINVSDLVSWVGSAYDGLNLKLYEAQGYSLYVRNFAFSTEDF